MKDRASKRRCKYW